MEKEERDRAHNRVYLIEDILVDGTTSCTSADISEGGIYLSTLQSYEPGSIIELTIPLNGEKITVKAQVKYCHQGIGIGLMFQELDKAKSLKIREFIYSRIG